MGEDVTERKDLVRDYMNGVLLHTDKGKSVYHVAQLMHMNNAHAVIVRDGGVPVGIVTSKDIIKSLVSSELDSRDVPISDHMTSPIVAIDHEEHIGNARDLMLDSGLRKIPVREEMDIVGLVVQTDLIRNLSWYNKFK